MKICSHCGTMMSPHPLHKTEQGICADCFNDLIVPLGRKPIPPDPVNDGPPPKFKGKHMIVQKSQAQIIAEKRKRELGRRFY